MRWPMRLACAMAWLAAPASPFAAPGGRAPRAACRLTPLRMRAPELTYERGAGGETLRFGGSQRTITMVRPEPAVSLEQFVTSRADAIVLSSWPPGAVTRRDGTADEFTIRVEEFDFVAMRVAVELSVRCWVDAPTRTAHLESTGFRLLGDGLPAGMADAIRVDVRGSLRPSAPNARLCSLSGEVGFVAEGALPSVLRGAPDGALRAAANAMSTVVIAAAAERFATKVPEAYARFAREGASP